MLETLLHLLATALQGERAAKLLLLPGGSMSMLVTIRDVVLPLAEQPALVYAAMRLFYVCCNDDTCTKTRDWVVSDPLIIKHVSATLGQAVASSGGGAKEAPAAGKPEIGGFSKSDAVTQGLVETVANFVKTVSFNKLGQDMLVKAPPTTGALLVTSLTFALQFAVTNAVMGDIEAMMQQMAKEGV